MDRLTERDEFGNADIIGVDSQELTEGLDFNQLNLVTEALNRLAAYEDTRLEPERVAELAQAEKDGRLVVLPCKVGDTVWRIIDDCEFPGDCGTKMKCNGCEYRNLFIEEWAFQLSLLGQNGKLNPPFFLTREAAEAALDGEEETNNGR